MRRANINQGLNQDGSISAPMRRYVLLVLMATYAVNLIDRQILAILVVPIKIELGLSDASLGFLTGFAFALFYAAFGLPIAWLADRYNRRNLIALALALWSGMTALSGLAQSFWHLALARIGVAIGEAGGSPPAHSMISDLYRPDQRSTALAIYGLGIPLGTLVGLAFGGWISGEYGWRTAFFAAGVPGLLLAVLLRLTVPEPERAGVQGAAAKPQAPRLLTTLRHMTRSPVVVHIAAGGSIITAVGAAFVAWTPAFLNRTYGMPLQDIGLALGLIAGIPGGLGMYLGGALADRFGARHPGWYLWIVAVALALMCPFALASYLAPNATLSLLLLIPPFTFGIFFYQAASFAQLQNHVEPRMRAVAAASILFIFNLLGQGLGPQVVGITSDLLEPALGARSLGIALAAFSMLSLWAALHYFYAGRLLARDHAGTASG